MSNDRIAKARELLEKFPDKDLARFSLAQAYFDADDFQNSTAHLRPLCAKKPDWMVVHILQGKCLLALHEPAEAKQILEHARHLAISQHHDGPLEELTQLLAGL